MEKKPLSLLIPLLVLISACGLVIILLSFSSLPPPWMNSKGIRVLGFMLALVGFGEYLNHPKQEKRLFMDADATKPITIHHRTRNPCVLGNLLDVIAIILVFVALTLFFFPHEP